MGLFYDEDYEGAQKDVLCNLQEKAGIPPSWILLSSPSKVDVFCNSKILMKIREAKRHLVMHCNAGTMLFTQKGELKGYGSIWYHPTGIANILSLNNVFKKYQVTFDSEVEHQAFVVNKEDGLKQIFRLLKKGLYYSDILNDVGTILVHTVDSNKAKFSIRQYSIAKKAHILQDVIGRLSTENFIKYIEGNMVPNCNTTRQDILRARHFWAKPGPAEGQD